MLGAGHALARKLRNRMKTLLGLAALGVATAVGLGATLGLCATSSAAPATSPDIPPWGFDLAGRDTAVAPGTDFYGYANGDYVKKLVIPPDRSRYGAFDALQALSETRVHAILEKAAARSRRGQRRRQDRRLLPRLHGRAARRCAGRGADPAGTGRDPRRRHAPGAGQADGRGREGLLRRTSSTSMSSVDAKDPDHYAVYLGQAGLGPADRDYYLEPELRGAEGQVPGLRRPDAEAGGLAGRRRRGRGDRRHGDPDRPGELEHRRAARSDQDLQPDDAGRARRRSRRASTGAPSCRRRPRRTRSASSSTRTTAVPEDRRRSSPRPRSKTLQAWEAFNVADSAAPFLSQPFVDANFEFRAKTLSRPAGAAAALEARGRPRQRRHGRGGRAGSTSRSTSRRVARPRWRRWSATSATALARAHPARRLDERRDQGQGAAEALHAERQDRLPDQVARLLGAQTSRATTCSATCATRSRLRVAARSASRLGQPVDKTEWGMTPQTVNAYYNPTRNEIVFPAAILQPPFFDPARRHGGQLRRHRRGDRPRDDARLRRPGPPVRRRRAGSPTGGRRGRRQVRAQHRRGWARSIRPSSRSPARTSRATRPWARTSPTSAARCWRSTPTTPRWTASRRR